MHCLCQARVQVSSIPIWETLLEAFARAILLHMLFGGLPLRVRERLVGHLAGVQVALCARLQARRTAATLGFRRSFCCVFRASHSCFLRIATTHRALNGGLSLQ